MVRFRAVFYDAATGEELGLEQIGERAISATVESEGADGVAIRRHLPADLSGGEEATTHGRSR